MKKCLIFAFLFTFNVKYSEGNGPSPECVGNDIFVKNLTPLSKSIVPKLEGKAKGESGRIGIIGGSTEYAGAPYFAAMAALRTGADIVYVITTDAAAPIIKSYSPDLIVYPFLHLKTASKLGKLIHKLDVVVIGPGLGREDEAIKLIHDVIISCKTLKKPLIIDADGLYAISKNHSVLKDYPSPGAILTPNHRESKMLLETRPTITSNGDYYWGDYVSVLTKGENDQFNSSVPCYNWALSVRGSARRAGGQGDILAGTLATLYYWALQSNLVNEHPIQLSQSVTAFSAAKLTRICNYKAFSLHGRSMIASDMLKEIHTAFVETFE